MQRQARIRGHWQLNLPVEDPTIIVRCFAEPVASTSTSQNQLEVAWRAINGSAKRRVDTEEAHDTLLSPCATIHTAGVSVAGLQGIQRELWVFSSTPEGAVQAAQETSQLTAIILPIRSFRVSQIVPCALQHERCDLQCNSSSIWKALPTKGEQRYIYGAPVRSDQESDSARRRAWAIFAQAAAEKLAWQAGERWPFQAWTTLYTPALLPTDRSALYLAIAPRHKSSRERRSGSINARLARLKPLGLQATLITKYRMTRSRSRLLIAGFIEYFQCAQEAEAENIEWSVLWVSLNTLGLHLQRPPDSIDEGVLVVWPDALIEYAIKPRARTHLAGQRVVQYTHRFASDATALFDFLSRSEPSINDGLSPQVSPPGDSLQVEESDIAMLMVDGSDDLFSAASSPRENVDTPHNLTEVPIPSQPISPLSTTDRDRASSLQRPGAVIDSITDIDFDFFDAPLQGEAQGGLRMSDAASPKEIDAPYLTDNPPLLPLDPHLTGESVTFEISSGSEVLATSSHVAVDSLPSPPASPGSMSHFEAMDMRRRSYAARYGTGLLQMHFKPHSELARRLKLKMTPSPSGADPGPSWLDERLRRPLPRREAWVGIAQPASEVGGLYSPPTSPPQSPEAEISPLRFQGTRCLSTELFEYVGQRLSDLELDVLSRSSDAVKLDGGSSHELVPPVGALSSPPPSPRASTSWPELNLSLLAHEVIWNSNFLPDTSAVVKSVNWSDGVLRHLPPALSLHLLSVPEATTPPTKTRRRASSNNKLRPNLLTPSPLKAPRLAVAYLGDVITIAPEGLQFWKELGVGPVSGTKDMTFYSLRFTDGPGPDWASAVATAYETLHLGSHVEGRLNGRGPVLQVNSVDWRDMLSNIRRQKNSTPFVVIYIQLPDSEAAAEIAGAILNCNVSDTSTHQPSPVYHLIHPAIPNTPETAASMAFDVYNRCRRRTPGVASRSCVAAGNYTCSPAYHLADGKKSESTLNSFSLHWPTKTHDVMRAGKATHCSYHWCARSDILAAFCIDAAGIWLADSAWHLPSDRHSPADVVAKLYNFGIVNSSASGRLIFCSKGAPSMPILQAWRNFLDGQPAVNVDVMCVTSDIEIFGDSDMAAATPQAPSIIPTSTSRLRFKGFQGSVVFLPHRTAIFAEEGPDSANVLYPLASMFILFGCVDAEQVPNLGVHILITSSDSGLAEQEQRQQLAESFHHLCVLTMLRYGQTSGLLPIHLHAVELASEYLTKGRGRDA